jgi:prolyl oligopeptidase
VRARRIGPLALAIGLTAALCRAADDPLAPVDIAKPPLAVVEPITETLHGTRIIDPYRYFERMEAPTLDWMRAQADYTRAVFDGIGPRAALAARVTTFTGAFDAIVDYSKFGGREFFLGRGPSSDEFDLLVRDTNGARTLIDVGVIRANHGGAPYAINYYAPSPDGTKVAAGLSSGGSEDASLYVYDTATSALIAGPIDRAEYGGVTWRNDSSALYFIRLKRLEPGAPETDKYKDTTIDAWDLTHAPVPLLGRTVRQPPASHAPTFSPVENPQLVTTPGSNTLIALNLGGVTNELAAWTTSDAWLANRRLAWKALVTRDDAVTGIELRGDELFLLSHRDAPMFKVLSLRVGRPLSQATTLLAPRADRLVESIHAASDALYVLTLEGIYSHLLRIPAGSTVATEVALPFRGYASGAFADPREPGITVTFESWIDPPRTLAYDPATQRFTDLELGIRPPFDREAFAVDDVEALAKDGAQVPLTILRAKSTTGPAPTLIDAYGAYGISELPYFAPRTIAFLREGGVYASCHVRGGGERGEAWRLAGKDANKPNSWRDLIACTEELIARGVTTRSQAFVTGASAGGITVGMAAVERPDLFAGAIAEVPAVNPTRDEFSANGPPNIPEFGTIATSSGFTNLLAMDPYQHVRDGVDYPAMLIATGLNDPRVPPWEPAKFAARLQASGTPNPVLLRVDSEAGHGVGSTRSQRDAMWLDTLSFVFWRAGTPGWRPDAATLPQSDD